MKRLTLRDEAFLYFLALTLMVSVLVGTLSGPLTGVIAFNNATIHNNNTPSTITNGVIKIAKSFAVGDIPNFPQPWITASGGGTRTLAAAYQTKVLTRHRDATSVRTISDGRAGGPVFSTTTGGGNGMLTGVSVASHIATVTTTGAGIPHGIVVGDQVQAFGTPTTANYPVDPGNMIVHEVISTSQFRYISRQNVSGVFSNSSTTTNYTGGGGVVTVTQKIDPLEQPDQCRLKSDDHHLYRGETVTIPNTMAGLTITTPLPGNKYLITGHTEDWIVINARCTGTWTSGSSITGPEYGSVEHAIIKIKAPTNPSGGNVSVDYVNSVNPCSSGNAAACDAAGLDKAGMLAMSWEAMLIATADVKTGAAASYSVNARTQLQVTADFTTPTHCGPRIYDRGPVDTEVIVERACMGTLDYDFGWKIRPGSSFAKDAEATDTEIAVNSIANIDVGSKIYVWEDAFVEVGTRPEIMQVQGIVPSTTMCDGVTIPAGPCLTVMRGIAGTPAALNVSGRNFGMFQWEDATAAYLSLHPVWYLRFIPGVGVEIILEVENIYFRKHQNLWYSYEIRTGPLNANIRISKPTFKHLNSSSWSKRVFDPPENDPEFFCKGGAGTDPEKCSSTGGGERAQRIVTNHNAAYAGHAKIQPTYRFYSGQATKLDTIVTGFRQSDMGDVSPTTLQMGGGTFGAQFVDQPSSIGPTGPTKGFDGAQEAHAFPDTQAMCQQNYSEACYEINYGTRAPGGGGNVEVAFHIPWNHKDDFSLNASTPGFIMPGFTDVKDSAFGKFMSLYNHPTWVGSTDSSDGSGDMVFDKRFTACSLAAPEQAPFAIPNGSNVAGTRGWACHHLLSIGNDDWLIDNTHQSEWVRWAYETTGHPRYLKQLYNMAAYNMGQNKSDPGRMIGKPWSQPESRFVADRGKGVWLRDVAVAAIYAPNQPLFGFTKPPVATFYWREKLVDMALSQEGIMELRTGLMSKMYPFEDISACPALPKDYTRNIWFYTHCEHGLNHPNPLHLSGFNTGAACPGTHPWIDCTLQYAEGDWWWRHHAAMWWGITDYLGWDMFRDVRIAWFNTIISMHGSNNYNKYMADLYTSPMKLAGKPIVTFSEMLLGLKATWTVSGNVGGRNDADWCHQGDLCGAPDVPASSYGPQWLTTLSYLWPLTSSSINAVANYDGCTANCNWPYVYDFFSNNATLPITTPQNMTKFMVNPSGDPLDLECAASPASATCIWRVPDTTPCSYKVTTTRPTTSLDSDYTMDTQTNLGSRVLVIPRTAPDTQFITIICGQRLTGVVDGTGKAIAQFSFPASKSGLGGTAGLRGSGGMR